MTTGYAKKLFDEARFICKKYDRIDKARNRPGATKEDKERLSDLWWEVREAYAHNYPDRGEELALILMERAEKSGLLPKEDSDVGVIYVDVSQSTDKYDNIACTD